MMQTDLSRNLALLRKEQKLSQKAAAEALDVTQARLSHYETGARQPSTDFICRACDFYHVSADFMIGRTLTRDGGTLHPEDIPENDGSKDNKVGAASMGSVVGRKLVCGAINVLFDVIGRMQSSRLTTAATNHFADMILLFYRDLYPKHADNEQDMFSVSHPLYATALRADMEQQHLAFLHELETQDWEQQDLSDPAMRATYDRLMSNFQTLIHQAGERARQITDSKQVKP